jgi:hypothetical protein
MAVKDIGWESVDRICLAQNNKQWWALMNTVTKYLVPENAGNFTIWETISLSTLVYVVSYYTTLIPSQISMMQVSLN